MFSVEKERKEFPVFKDEVYLNHATTGLIPNYSLKAMKEHLSLRNTKGMNGSGLWEMWGRADKMRDSIAEMIGCEGAEIVYGSSSTQLFNIFANGIGLKHGDNVVTTDSTYPADAYVWLNKAADGIELRYAKSNCGELKVDGLFELVDENTRVISICLVDYQTGFRHDVAEIGQRCHERGIYLIVDATQATNALHINLKELHVDFMTTSSYKWLLSPFGLGFAYISKALLPKLSQSIIGWVGTADRSHNSAQELKLSDEARRSWLNTVYKHGLWVTLP